jgi:transcriptional regulator with XRE-family HTH domain
MDIGTRIAAWRRAKGRTQKAIADAVGVTISAVSRWESGEAPSHGHLEAAVASLGITMARFYGAIPKRARRVA